MLIIILFLLFSLDLYAAEPVCSNAAPCTITTEYTPQLSPMLTMETLPEEELFWKSIPDQADMANRVLRDHWNKRLFKLLESLISLDPKKAEKIFTEQKIKYHYSDGKTVGK